MGDRLRVRFRIRTIMGLTLLVALGAGWLTHRAVRLRLATQTLEDQSVTVYRDHKRAMSWKRPIPMWMRRSVPSEYYAVPIELDAFATQLSDLTPLRVMPELESIDLESSKVTDLSPIKNLKELHYLDLEATGVSDLSPLAKLPKLDGLSVCWNRNLKEIGPLANVRSLRRLDLSATLVRDLKPLAALPRLEYLDVGHLKDLNLSPLVGIASLRELHLGGCTGINLGPLKRMKQLKKLTLPNETEAKQSAEIRAALPGCRIDQSI